VKASLEHAFKVFTDGFDSWWPRSHHIGKQPMVTAVMETRAGGRCFGREADGTECDWGRVLTWEPPNRFVLAWQIDAKWQYEPDLEKASEVEVRFTPEAAGLTRVDLEHRHFERHGEGFDTVRSGVNSPNGWGSLLQAYAARATEYHPAVAPLALIFTMNDSLALRPNLEPYGSKKACTFRRSSSWILLIDRRASTTLKWNSSAIEAYSRSNRCWYARKLS
jgi:uncharacterized protein YndB with AHSA1/START domain